MNPIRLLPILLAGLLLSCGLRSRSTLEASDEVAAMTAVNRAAAEVAAADAPAVPAPLPPADRKLRDYVLLPGDRIQISFPHAKEMDFAAFVRPDGRVTSPMYGDLMAEGLTPAELGANLGDLYARDLKQPTAHVALLEMGPRSFYVFGEVHAPSRYAWEQNIDLVQALSQAGGALRTANLGKVVLLQVGADGAYRFDVHDLENLAAGDRPAPVYVGPRDIVIVPTSTIADVGIWLDQYVKTFLPPIDTFLRGRYYWYLAKDIAGTN